jgi:hypothetical protein
MKMRMNMMKISFLDWIFGAKLKWTVIVKCLEGNFKIYREWKKGDYVFKEIEITKCPFVEKCDKRDKCDKEHPCKGIIWKAYVRLPEQKTETEKLLEKMRK